MKRFTWLSLGFSKKLEDLEATSAVFPAYDNFCRQTRQPNKVGRMRKSPPMAAGVVDSPWSFEDLLDRVMGSGDGRPRIDCTKFAWPSLDLTGNR